MKYLPKYLPKIVHFQANSYPGLHFDAGRWKLRKVFVSLPLQWLYGNWGRYWDSKLRQILGHITGFQPAHAPSVPAGWNWRTACRLKIGDTAGWKTCATFGRKEKYALQKIPRTFQQI